MTYRQHDTCHSEQDTWCSALDQAIEPAQNEGTLEIALLFAYTCVQLQQDLQVE